MGVQVGTPYSRTEHARLDDLRQRIRDSQHSGRLTAASALAMLMEMVELLDWLLEAQDMTDEAMHSMMRPATFAVPKGDFARMLLGHTEEEEEKKDEAESGLHEGERGARSPYMAAGQYL